MVKNPEQIIFRYKAGSQAYGLDTPQSDVDWRGVYLLDDPALVIDPFRYSASSQKCCDSIKDGVDEAYHEIRHFFNILYAANTNAIEMLFVDEFALTSPLFQKIRANKESLIDPHKFYKALKGYLQSETRLAIGERTGKLGGKRFEQVQKYGFSPKNFVQLFRLTFAGKYFFEHGDFPINMKRFEHRRAHLMEIKTEPECFTKEELLKEVQTAERHLDQAYKTCGETRAKQYKYDKDFVTSVMLEAYAPLINKHVPKKKGFFSFLK